MPTHGLPREHEGNGPGHRKLVQATASVADEGTVDTGYTAVYPVSSNVNADGAYAINIYKTGGASGGVLYFNIYNIEGSADATAVSVDYTVLAERG